MKDEDYLLLFREGCLPLDGWQRLPPYDYSKKEGPLEKLFYRWAEISWYFPEDRKERSFYLRRKADWIRMLIFCLMPLSTILLHALNPQVNVQGLLIINCFAWFICWITYVAPLRGGGHVWDDEPTIYRLPEKKHE